AKTEAVIEELSPHPAALSDAVCAEAVLAHPIDHAIPDESHRRTDLHAGDPIRIVRRRHAKVESARPAPCGMGEIVVPAVECPCGERGCVARCGSDREGDDRKNECNDDGM